jgi:16S rRNA (uracil1498-N3)-methyltransferase
MADRFYCAEPLGPGDVELVGAEAHHLATVRRFSPGDQVVLFNGDGKDYPAEVVSIGKRSVLLNVLRVEAPNREVDGRVIVAAAVPKADRADFLVEKLTELGATAFIPLVTSRSAVHPKDSSLDRFRRTVIEASKQCGRNRLMTVEAVHSWPALLARNDLPTTRLVLHTGPQLSAFQPHQEAVLAIGPEGGFTDEELSAAQQAGWQRVSLGPRTLRIETAAVAAAAILTVLRPLGQVASDQ